MTDSLVWLVGSDNWTKGPITGDRCLLPEARTWLVSPNLPLGPFFCSRSGCVAPPPLSAPALK